MKDILLNNLTVGMRILFARNACHNLFKGKSLSKLFKKMIPVNLLNNPSGRIGQRFPDFPGR